MKNSLICFDEASCAMNKARTRWTRAERKHQVARDRYRNAKDGGKSYTPASVLRKAREEWEARFYDAMKLINTLARGSSVRVFVRAP